MHSLAGIICGRDELQDLSQDQILLIVKAFERRASKRHVAVPQKGEQGGALHHELFYRLEPYILKLLFDRQLTGFEQIRITNVYLMGRSGSTPFLKQMVVSSANSAMDEATALPAVIELIRNFT